MKSELSIRDAKEIEFLTIVVGELQTDRSTLKMVLSSVSDQKVKDALRGLIDNISHRIRNHESRINDLHQTCD